MFHKCSSWRNCWANLSPVIACWTAGVRCEVRPVENWELWSICEWQRHNHGQSLWRWVSTAPVWQCMHWISECWRERERETQTSVNDSHDNCRSSAWGNWILANCFPHENQLQILSCSSSLINSLIVVGSYRFGNRVRFSKILFFFCAFWWNRFSWSEI